MKNTALSARLVLVALAALLTALPLAESAPPVEAKKRPKTVTRTFRNSAAIDVFGGPEGPNPAKLYPSPIAVKGLRGRIRDVNVRLAALTHNVPEELDVLLVGPGGQTAVVMAQVGGSADVANVTLRLDDEAAAPLPDEAALQSRAHRPTNAEGSIAFIAPAPSANANAALSIFDGVDPNGTWRLFVQEDASLVGAGAFSGGWALEITVKAKGKRKR